MPELPSQTTASIISAIDANAALARTVAGGLSPVQFNWPPAPGVWSIGQNLGHLNILDGAPTVSALRTSVALGRAQNITASGPFHSGFIASKLITSQAPPVTKKYKAPKSLAAPPDLDPSTTLAYYLHLCEELHKLVESAAGLDLARISTTLPLLPPVVRSLVRMSLVGRLTLLTTHDSRHLWQCEQIRQNPAFPK